MANQIWFISDSHFWHSNIIRYCHRPYATRDGMNESIINKWNSVVKKDDIVYHLGDFAFFHKSETQKVIELRQKLNGKIYLLLGNHDREICKHLNFWYDLGFDKVYDQPTLIENRYIISHEPLITRYNLDLHYYNELKNIHGHTHNLNFDYYNLTEEQKKVWLEERPDFHYIPDITKYSFNVSIEVIDYKPIKFETIVDKMKKKEKEK